MKNLSILFLLLNLTFLLSFRADIAAKDNINNNSWDWNTFLGCSNSDYGNDIAVDGSGNVYVVGTSGENWGSPINANAGDDAFVAKLNSSGELQWNTFMGSSNFDYGESIAVDGDGNVYVAGRSYLTWGSPVNEFAASFGYDAFAAKLNNDGELQWSTFMGSPTVEYCRSIAVDGSGNVYVTGSSDATWGSPVNAHAGGNYDAFAIKLNSNGIRQWNTFMGSSADDGGRSIAVDGSGNVYVAGNSDATWGSPVNAFASDYDYDAFVVKLNSNGVRQWHTFMGSSADDQSRDIAVDGSGNIYVTGYSDETWGSPVNELASYTDAFVAKLNSSGVRQWHTFMGGSTTDEGNGIAVDGSGNVYIAGISILSSWGSPVNEHAGGDDAFAAMLNNSGVRQWNTFMGSEDSDEGYGIAVDGSGIAYVVGRSYFTWGSPVNEHAGGFYDAFAVKFQYTTAVEDEIDLNSPTEFNLAQNYPNPFNARTIIKYTLSHADHVTLKVYNISGEEIKTLVNAFQTQNNYEIVFDATQLSSGIYLYELTIGNSHVQMKKMILIK